jgi:MYXO-CTERM domain-containing protein
VDVPRVDVTASDTPDATTAADLGVADVGDPDTGADAAAYDVPGDAPEDDVPTTVEADGSTAEWDGGPDADEAPTPDAAGDGAGCQCDAGATVAPSPAAAWAGLLGLALMWRRRRSVATARRR